jgi:hypothetical protein
VASIEDRLEFLRGVLDELRGEMCNTSLVGRLEELLDEINNTQEIPQLVSQVQ